MRLDDINCCRGWSAGSGKQVGFRLQDRMNFFRTTIKWVLLCLACATLTACANGRTTGERMADLPHWMGGEPDGVPPRRGTPEYDAWMAARAQEAATPKAADHKPDQQPK